MPEASQEKTVLITGAAGILAKHISRRLIDDGYKLILTDRLDLGPLAASLGDAVVDCRSCDLSEVSDVDNLINGLMADHQIDILINNAAIQTQYTLEEFTPELLRLFNRVNVEVPYQFARKLAPAMAERRWGRIVNLVSSQAWRPYPNFIGYVTSKGGLVGLTRALACEFGDRGITVNGVTPSATQTVENAEVMTAEAWESVRNAQVIKRNATPQDLVGAVSFLVSDDAGFITAQTIFADGGLVML